MGPLYPKGRTEVCQIFSLKTARARGKRKRTQKAVNGWPSCGMILSPGNLWHSCEREREKGAGMKESANFYFKWLREGLLFIYCRPAQFINILHSDLIPTDTKVLTTTICTIYSCPQKSWVVSNIGQFLPFCSGSWLLY